MPFPHAKLNRFVHRDLPIHRRRANREKAKPDADGVPFKPSFGLSGVVLHLPPTALLFPLAEEQADSEEAAGEEEGKARLKFVVAEEGENAIKGPGGRQHKPDDRAPHGSEITSRHSFDAADTLPAWLPRSPRIG